MQGDTKFLECFVKVLQRPGLVSFFEGTRSRVLVFYLLNFYFFSWIFQ